MGIVSYAQNFEDVMLWRALGHVREGFWIDIGAADPDRLSVTRAFSERGWRGVNVEPVLPQYARLCNARPRDINLNMAAGAAPGRVTFHRIGATGLSTLDAGIAEAHRSRGWHVETQTVAVVTLADICRRHVRGEVHFLKIDVEGAEAEVLRGADFEACRPWIVLVESIRPDTGESSHAAWEGRLLAYGYRFVWFDALNRFYVAEERLDDMAKHFVLPPNVHDGFRLAEEAGMTPSGAAPAAPPTAPAAAPPTPPAPPQPAGPRLALPRGPLLPALKPRLRAAARLVALAGWKVIRPVTRPMLWRLRSFFVGQLLREVQELRAEHDETLRTVVGLTAGGGFAPYPEPGRPATAPPPPRTGGTALRRVHQFHSGSATADAITNAMRLLRSLLRASGYDSEIFVEHLDPDLADDLLPIDALPLHGDYVLIVRHSMGHGVFDRIAALPAHKILHYHNITPPEFLGGDPAMAAAAIEGRRQLAAWRPHVLAATANSAYNALELRALGYDVVLECPLLFDADALRARAAATPPRPGDAPFTVLFVGRLVESKAQDELIDAFAAFAAGFGAPCRLLLVGRGSEAAGTALRTRALRHGLGKSVELAGVLSDAALDAAFAAADLYVSLSRHEGFGVPLVEAMAHGVPVLAWPAGAVAHTLGGAGVLLHDRAPAIVAAAMLALARDPARRAALAAAGRRRLADFSLRALRPVLQSALSLAGAAPPSPPGLRAELDANLHLTLAGHVNGSYSLAAVNRRIALLAEAARPGQVRLLPLEAGRAAELREAPAEELAALRALAARPAPPTGPEVVLCQHWPVLPPPHRGDLPLAMVFWEESAVPPDMVGVLGGFAGVLAPAPSVARALIESGVTVPVAMCGFAPDLAGYAALGAARGPREGRPYTFLHVSSCFPRKGVDVLLAAWAAAFRAGDPVRLVIKGFPNPHNDAAAQLAALRARDPDIAPVELIDRDLDRTALLALYAGADAMVLPTRGEGFNIPAAEAIAAGLALLVTGWGGHMGFCAAPGAARLLRFRLRPAASHVAAPGALWAEPDAEDLAAALRAAVAQEYDAAAISAREAARRELLARFEPGAWMAGLRGLALDLLLAPPPPPRRLAWVSTWRVACGIATYSRALLGAFADHPGFAGRHPVVLCDTRGFTDEDELGLRAVAGWKLGDRNNAGALAMAVAAEDPDILVIQHQPMLVPFEALADLLEHPALRRRVVVVALHATMPLLEAPPELRARVVAALGRVARVLVHTSFDLDTLQDLGLLERTALLPHGLPAPRPPRPPRELPPGPVVEGAAPVIGCHGFVLPGKGMPLLIEAVARLRETWPGLRLRMVTALFPAEFSQAELSRCRALAEALGIAGAVEWYTGFLPPQRVLDLLQGCDVLALPYEIEQGIRLRRAAHGGGFRPAGGGDRAAPVRGCRRGGVPLRRGDAGGGGRGPRQPAAQPPGARQGAGRGAGLAAPRQLAGRGGAAAGAAAGAGQCAPDRAALRRAAPTHAALTGAAPTGAVLTRAARRAAALPPRPDRRQNEFPAPSGPPGRRAPASQQRSGPIWTLSASKRSAFSWWWSASPMSAGGCSDPMCSPAWGGRSAPTA